MNRSFILHRALTYLLALSLVIVPLAPAFAMVAGGDAAHAAQFSHGCDHEASGASFQADRSSSCTQHESCAGECCAGCAHCVGAFFLVQPLHAPSHPVQTPVLSRLHSRVLITSPDRPPRSFSL